MFGTLGGPELLLILVIALIVFGPRKLPEIGKSVGKMLVEFRRASNDFKRTIEDEVEADKMREALEAPAAPAPPVEAAQPKSFAEAARERLHGPGETSAPAAPVDGQEPPGAAPADGGVPRAEADAEPGAAEAEQPPADVTK